MKKRICSFLLVFFIFFSFFVFNVDAKEGDNDFYCSLCTKDKNDPLYIKERQFYEKIYLIKQVFKDSIDEVVLAYTVLHRYGQDYTYNTEYTKNFSSDKYKSMWDNFKLGVNSGNVELSEAEAKLVQENEKIDLLTIATIVMVDSNHLGTYSDACYKDGLAGDKLVGNTSNSGFFVDLQNALFCGAYTVSSEFVVNPIVSIASILHGSSFLINDISIENKMANIRAVCENGYIGGLYSDVGNLKDDSFKTLLKKRRAQEILDYANYYKDHYGNGSSESIGEISCPIGSVNGNTQGSDITGSRAERINQIGPAAQAVYSKTGVFASVTIAQAIQESQIGADGAIALSNNNLFGIKCRDGRECKSGYAVYSSIEEGIEDHAKLFDNGAYPEWRSATTPEEFIRRVGPVYCPVSDGCGDYAGSIINLIEEENLKKWDVKENVSSNENCGVSGSVGGWNIRTIKPSESDESFTEMEKENGNSNRGQCVWYAKGRAFEIVNSLKDNGKLSEDQASHIKKLLSRAYGNGGDVYDNAKSVFNGSDDIKKPKAGSYIVWKKPGKAGHIAIVEEVNNSKNTITITGGYSSSKLDSCPNDWSCVQFQTKTMSLDEFYDGYGKSYVGGYNFSGYIYFLEPLDMKDAWVEVSNSSGETCQKSGNVTADLAVAVTPVASPDKTVSAPENYHRDEFAASCGKYYTPNAWYDPTLVDQRYADYAKVMDMTINAERGGDKGYGSCSQAAAGIIRASVDPDFDATRPAAQYDYAMKHPEKWELVHVAKPGEKFDEICEPGDVLIAIEGWHHTMIYIGNKAARQKFPNTDANIFQANFKYCNYARYPKLERMDSAPVTFYVFRSTGGGEFKNSFIDISEFVNNSNICSNEDSYCVNGRAYGNFVLSGDLGNKMAQLAVRVSPNADPEPRILGHAWLHNGLDRATIDPRMHDYIKIFDATTTSHVGDHSNPAFKIIGEGLSLNNPAYCSCTQTAGAIVRAIADPDFDMSGAVGDPAHPKNYLDYSPEKWVAVGEVKVGEKFDDKCQPGDLLVSPDPPGGHVMLYVGNEAVRVRFPNSNANMFQGGYAGPDSNESWCPQLNYVPTHSKTYTIWRPTGRGKFYYPFINIDEVLAGPMQTGRGW